MFQVKNPDGSLAQAAMMQGALSKERRETKMTERQQQESEQPTGFTRTWADPLRKAEGDEAAQNTSTNKLNTMNPVDDMPEWKKHIIGQSALTLSGLAFRNILFQEAAREATAGRPL